MTALGWLMMVASVSSVLALAAFCLFRVLTLPPSEVEHLAAAPLEIDKDDTREPD